MTRAQAFGCMPGFHRWDRFLIPRYLHLPPHLGGKILDSIEVIDKCNRCPHEERKIKAP